MDLFQSQPGSSRDRPWSVREFTDQFRGLVNELYANVWIAGEVSTPRQHANGHLYLTMKDSDTQLPAVIWQSTLRRIRFDLKHGLEVIARGKIDIYPPHGKYQFVIAELIPKGIGALELAFRQLKEKLERRGWFAAERKKPLPRYPRCVALVTSPTGAVIRDMLRIIHRRWPIVEILVCPVAVQGPNAAVEIADMIRLLNEHRCADVMIVGRGGGSLEDLWPFNEELLAQAIVESAIPVISAVGHETDFTIADFVADFRAATPSEAAEKVVPDQQEFRAALGDLQRHLDLLVQRRLGLARKELIALTHRRIFRQPLAAIHDRLQRLDDWQDRLERALAVVLEGKRQQTFALAGRLETLSPLQVLSRGYSLTTIEGSPLLLRSAGDVSVGDRLVTRLWKGRIVSRVERTTMSNE